jgi:peptidase E
MKLNKETLKQIIKEELGKVLNETYYPTRTKEMTDDEYADKLTNMLDKASANFADDALVHILDVIEDNPELTQIMEPILMAKGLPTSTEEWERLAHKKMGFSQ